MVPQYKNNHGAAGLAMDVVRIMTMNKNSGYRTDGASKRGDVCFYYCYRIIKEDRDWDNGTGQRDRDGWPLRGHTSVPSHVPSHVPSRTLGASVFEEKRPTVSFQRENSRRGVYQQHHLHQPHCANRNCANQPTYTKLPTSTKRAAPTATATTIKLSTCANRTAPTAIATIVNINLDPKPTKRYPCSDVR